MRTQFSTVSLCLLVGLSLLACGSPAANHGTGAAMVAESISTTQTVEIPATAPSLPFVPSGFTQAARAATATPGSPIPTPFPRAVTVTPAPPTPSPIPATAALTPVPLTPTQSQPTATVIPATPAPAPNMSIVSMPAGSEVYIADVRDLGITIVDQADWDVLVRRLLGFNRLAMEDAFEAVAHAGSAAYYSGAAPLSIHLEPGNYIVRLAVPESDQLPGDISPFEFDDGSTYGSSILGSSDGLTSWSYLVEITSESDYENLIQIWQPKSWSLAQIAALYPEQEVFKIDEEGIKADLEGNIPDSDIPTVLQLLRKGGKVVYREDETHRIILQIDPDTGSLDTMLRYEDS